VAAESSDERATLETYILRDENIIDFLALIESVGREQGVGLTTRTLEVVNPDLPYEELKIEIEVVGTHDAVLHTVRMFENIPYQSYMSGLSFAQTSNAEIQNAWRTSFSLFVTKYMEGS
jgi:hypothetical protein